MDFLKKHLITIVLVVAIGFLTYFLLTKDDPEVVTVRVPVLMEVKVPEQKIVFEPSKLPIPKKEKKPSITEFQNATDKDKDSLYQDAITERTYKETFKDSAADVTVISKVRGRLLKQEVKATIKEKTIVIDTVVEHQVTIKPKIKAYVGGYLTSGTDLTTPAIGAGVILKNRKDMQLHLGYDSSKRGMVGLYFNLFKKR